MTHDISTEMTIQMIAARLRQLPDSHSLKALAARSSEAARVLSGQAEQLSGVAYYLTETQAELDSLSEWLRAQRPQRVTAKALTEEARRQRQLHEAREAARPVAMQAGKEALVARVNARLLALGVAAIRERGVDTPTGYDEAKLRVTDRAPRQRMWVLHFNEYVKYSSRQSWWVSASYLCGIEDGQVWVERVPASITTVEEAVAYITPAAVKRAAAEGRQVLRQGDVFLVERRRGGDDLAALPERHRFDPGNRTLSHPQHGSLHVPFPFAVHLTRTVPTGARVHNWD